MLQPWFKFITAALKLYLPSPELPRHFLPLLLNFIFQWSINPKATHIKSLYLLLSLGTHSMFSPHYSSLLQCFLFPFYICHLSSFDSLEICSLNGHNSSHTSPHGAKVQTSFYHSITYLHFCSYSFTQTDHLPYAQLSFSLMTCLEGALGLIFLPGPQSRPQPPHSMLLPYRM